MTLHLTNSGTRPFVRATVADAMQGGLIACAPDASVTTIAQAMADESIHCVLVVGIERREPGGERLSWGIVSDLDLMGALQPGCETATAGDLAATDVLTVEPTDSLEHAAQLMAEHQTAHLIVASPTTDRPVGIVSSLDIARLAAEA
jgi:CBS domain-containing protein